MVNALSSSEIIFLIIVALVAMAIGGLLALLLSQKEYQNVAQENIQLKVLLEAEQKIQQERAAILTASKQQLNETFSALSSQALRKNNETFLNLANENLKQFHIHAEGAVEKKEQAIEKMLKPIQEALSKTETQVKEMEKERKEAYGSLHKHLETMTETQQKLHGETRNLVQALRRPEVRGQWGEISLKRLAELSGMVEHCDFFEQPSVNTAEGKLRPDMIVKLPSGRNIIIDVKTPLDAYIDAVEAPDDASKALALKRHARQVRGRMKELANKSYWEQFENTPDFVVLFIPGEQFLSTALDIDRSLLEDALQNKVILSTPTSFVALLRAVAYGWRQETLTKNAEKIRQIGEEMYDRISHFSEHLSKVGKSLDSAISYYNKAAGTFDARILPSTRKFTELGILAKKETTPIEQVEKSSKQLQSEVS